MAALFAKKKGSTEKAKEGDSKKEKEVLAEGSTGKVLASMVLRDPVITEKAHALGVVNAYAFYVDPSSSKKDIRKAVEQLYSVEVIKVTTVTLRPQKRYFGRTPGFTKKAKKALVRLKKGQSIDIFEESKK